MPDFPRFDLTNQVALVTGAGKGLGRAAALALADAGADVALGLRDATTGGEVVEAVRALGRTALPLQMDISDLAQVAAAVDRDADPIRTNRHPGEQRRDRAGESGGEGHGARLRSDVRRQLEGHVLRESGRGTHDDRSAPGPHHQSQLTGRLRGPAGRVGVLHDEGGDCPPDEVPRGRVGTARHHGQRGGPDLHRHTGNGVRAQRSRHSKPMSSNASRRCIGSASRWTWPGRSCFSLLQRRR